MGKIFYQKDVRDFGSGNAGATNTFRVLGKKAGIPVLLFDVTKGSLAVLLAYQFSTAQPQSATFVNLQLVFGVAALLGHIFPIYVGFRGGKGIATLLGIVIAIQPAAAAWCLVVFIIVFLSTKYVSLASMLASICYPLIVNLAYQTEITSLAVFSVCIALMVLGTHTKNIRRLIQGNENRANFNFGKSKGHIQADSTEISEKPIEKQE